MAGHPQPVLPCSGCDHQHHCSGRAPSRWECLSYHVCRRGLDTPTTNGSTTVVPTNDSLTATDPTAENDVCDDDLPQSLVPVAAPSMTEQEAVQQSVRQHQSSSSSHAALMWPCIGGVPLNEFTHEGYFTCAFSALFPTGAGDFLGQHQVQVTIGNHLMKYDDGRFARHPRFRFFALNTEMRHRAIQTGRVYIRQHPGDGQLSLDELRDMVGRQGEAFSSRVLHYASSLRGTKQRQQSRLLSMVDTLGLPTVFFTHSAADHQWQSWLNSDPDSRTARAKAVIENPALADWFFFHRVMKFVKAFYVGVLEATNWQHRGSPHVHGLAWLPGAPDVERLLDDTSDTVKEEIIKHADHLVSTTKPSSPPRR